MDLNSSEFAQFLDKLIEKKARQIIQAEYAKFGNLKGWVATIVGVAGDNSTADVQRIGESVTIPSLLNKTGVTLLIGDEVELHSLSSLSNSYIGIKK